MAKNRQRAGNSNWMPKEAPLESDDFGDNGENGEIGDFCENG